MEVQSPLFEQTRKAIAPFAEIVKRPEYIHTYQITDLSLWNAASSGISSQEVMERLQRYAKFPVMDYTIQELKTRFELLKKLMPNMSVPKQAKKEDLIRSLVSWVFAGDNLKVLYSKVTKVEA